MAYLDLSSWKHREHFEHFRGFARPFFGVCADVDVTAAWRRSRSAGEPTFFVLSVYAAVRAANAVEAMRLRIRDERVWVHERVGVSSTVSRADETFGYSRIDALEPLAAFAAHARQVIDSVKASHGLQEPNVDDAVVYHSTLPWLRFTAFSNAMAGTDSIPRLVFGQCVPDGQRRVMPVALEVHHALVHGRDAARFYQRLQDQLHAL